MHFEQSILLAPIARAIVLGLSFRAIDPLFVFFDSLLPQPEHLIKPSYLNGQLFAHSVFRRAAEGLFQR